MQAHHFCYTQCGCPVPERIQLPKVETSNFEGKISSVAKQLNTYCDQMTYFINFSEKVDGILDKRLDKLQFQIGELQQKEVAQEEAKHKIRVDLQTLQAKMAAIKSVQRVFENLKRMTEKLNSLNKDEYFSEEVEIFTVEEKPGPETVALFEQCKTEYYLALRMPPCFEQSLMAVNYLLALLCNIYFIDETLGLFTQYEKFERLSAEILKVLNLMGIEKVDHPDLKETLTQIKHWRQDVKEYQQILLRLEKFLNTIIRPFNFQKFFNLIEICDKNQEIIKGKSIILLLGAVGCGKTTTVQYLAESSMKQYEDGHIEAEKMDPELKEFIVNKISRSVTHSINPLFKKFKNNNDGETEEIVIIDTPGFGERQYHEVDISNCIAIQRSIANASEVRPVIIFNRNQLGGRLENMMEDINFYSKMIKKIGSDNKDSVNFLFLNLGGQDVKSLTQCIIGALDHSNNDHYKNSQMVETLKSIINLGEQERLLVLDPLDRNSNEFLNLIMNTRPIRNPCSQFNLFIKDSSTKSLLKQVELHYQFIIDSLQNDGINFELVSHKILELKRLANIFEPYDDMYLKKFTSIKKRLQDFTKEKIETAKKHISKQMDQGQKLQDQDIAKYNEALKYEKKISELLEEKQL